MLLMPCVPSIENIVCLKKYFYTTLISCILFIQLQAQQSTADIPAKHITSFPYTMITDGVMMIHATVNNFKDTLNLIFDTGSGGISLNISTVDSLKIKVVPSKKTTKGLGGIRQVSYLYDATMHLPGLDVEALDFHVNDYDLLTRAYGLRVDGIVGYSFLSRYIIKIDHEFRMIHVYSPGILKYPRRGYILHPNFSNIPIIDIQFSDSNMHHHSFYFDTGAGLNFLLSERYVTDSAVISHKKKKPVPTQAEAVGGKSEMYLTTVKHLQIGKYSFKNIPTHIFKDEYDITNYPQLGGLVGNDLLRRFNIILNYPQQEIHIKPNAHFREAFDYAYSGLALFYEEGHVVVDGVAKDSPAEKAGLTEGDIVLAVDNDFTGNLQTFKNIIQASHRNIEFLLLRNDKPLLLKMKTVSIK